MSGWSTVYAGEIERRPVKLEVIAAGAIEVTTTAIEDFQGTVTKTAGVTLVSPPVPAGAPVEIEEEDPFEMEKELREEGFSENAAREIVREAQRYA
jgi:hypothetical protein